MKKFLLIARATLNTYLAYRVNFIMWRVRTVFSLLLLYFLWSQILLTLPKVVGYTGPMIFSYILLGNFLNAVVLSTRTDQVAAEIRNGDIINFLLKPYNYFLRVGTREIVDKVVNIGFSIVETILFLVIFHPQIYIPTDPLQIVAAIGFVVIGLFIAFYISLALSLIAFWTPEIWAPRFIFMVFFMMIAGILFPLDIYPERLFNILMLTPFPYLVYVPASILTKGFTPNTPQLFAVSIFWLVTTWALVTLMWKKGLKEFTFFGR